MSVIPFVSSLPVSEQEQWLHILRKKMPNEIITPTHLIDENESKIVDVALVADPDPQQLLSFPNLAWIQSLWAGVEKLVTQLQHSPVKIVRLKDPQLANTMAEACLAWTLYLHRNMPQYARQQANQLWQQLDCPLAQDIRVSILGMGELGTVAAKVLKVHGYQVYGWSRNHKTVDGIEHFHGLPSLATMLPNTDILINLLPLTQDTKQLLNLNTLGMLPVGAKLINFSRGAVIDTNALITMLDKKHIAHAVLDVFEQEPLPTDSQLWQHSGITVLPHISAPTNLQSAASVVAKNIAHYRDTGEIPPSVDMIKGY